MRDRLMACHFCFEIRSEIRMRICDWFDTIDHELFELPYESDQRDNSKVFAEFSPVLG
jgi:hypothetical protein